MLNTLYSNTALFSYTLSNDPDLNYTDTIIIR